MRKGFFHLLLPIISIFVTFLFLECSLRFFYGAKPHGDQFLQEDPVLYQVHIPNNEPRVVSPFGEYNLKVEFNSHGLRGKELSLGKEENEFKILVLGDSFVEAREVSLESTMVQHMENSLNNKLKNKKIKMINAGVSGYSPILEYLYLKEKGILFKPDLILVYFCFNDVTDDYGKIAHATFDEFDLPTKISFIAKDEGKIYKKIKIYFLKRLALWRFVAERLGRLKVKLKIHKELKLEFVDTNCLKANALCIFKERYSLDDKKAWDKTKKYLKGIRRIAEENRIKMGLIAIPAPPQIDKEQRVVGKQKSWDMKADEVISLDKMQRVLSEFCAKNGIYYLDLSPAFKRNKEKKIFFDYDGHWTEKGNMIAAKETTEFLIQNNLLNINPKQ